MVKAYFSGIILCHTTNILNWWIDQTVQRNKPPLHEFPNLQISQMLFRKSFLVRSSFIWFLDFVSLLDWLYNSTAPLFCQHYFYIFYYIILFHHCYFIIICQFWLFIHVLLVPSITFSSHNKHTQNHHLCTPLLYNLQLFLP